MSENKKHAPPLRCRIAAKLVPPSPSLMYIRCALGRRRKTRLCGGCSANSREIIVESLEAMGVALGEAAKVLGKVVMAASDMAAVLLHGPLRDALTWHVALTWAKRQYPEWVAIMNRTKKRRVRKKYHDRILRAYKEVQI